ncbi:hypothetical protein [Agriterribacter humi]|jgi:hypothetical protein|uniref:hypothetical protein n=1 Tax=Agriterribacter humi TaxID=1104781 RepID=UPI001264015D|nr:hypothetical protein [Agriterribacter humi]
MIIPESKTEKPSMMLAKLKSLVFIDTLIFELSDATASSLRAVLKDDKGKVCSMFETEVEPAQKSFCWNGLNDLPYGVYTLELSGGKEEQLMRLVKRI